MQVLVISNTRAAPEVLAYRTGTPREFYAMNKGTGQKRLGFLMGPLTGAVAKLVLWRRHSTRSATDRVSSDDALMMDL